MSTGYDGARANRERGRRFSGADTRGWSVMKSTCADCGKRSYQTREDAKRAGRQVGGPHRVYQCAGSGMWHLTSQDAETVAKHRERP